MSGMRKLSNAQVVQLVKLAQDGEMDRDDIAEKFGVSEVYVGQLAFGPRQWRSGWKQLPKSRKTRRASASR